MNDLSRIMLGSEELMLRIWLLRVSYGMVKEKTPLSHQ
jgi:hypothetical protein